MKKGLSRVPRCAALALAVAVSIAGVASAKLVIVTSGLPAAPVGTEYEAAIKATGNVGALTWKVAEAPPGLELDPETGVLAGVPTAVGRYALEVTATDSEAPDEPAVKKLQLVVEFVIETSSLPAARVGTGYETNIQATGSVGELTWSLAQAPPGLSLGRDTGVLAGEPTAAGEYPLLITASDSGLPGVKVRKRLQLVVELALEANPISLGAVRKAPAGKPFTILLTVPVETEAQLEQLVYSVRFVSGEGETRTEAKPETSVSGPEVKEEGHVFTIEGIVPPYREIFGGTGLFEGWFLPERATIDVSAGLVDQAPACRSFDFEVPRTGWGTFWGLAAISLLFAIVGFMKPRFASDPRFDRQKDSRRSKWREKSRLVRFLQTPLRFCVTPIDTYSISLAQVLFWTALVIFSTTYVAFVRGGFLEITPQVLGLLGIGGGTAIAAKANAVIRSREVPEKYLQRIRRDRVPQLSDLISTRGAPNIFKFQMFAFTLINGLVVLTGIYTGFGFPEIPAAQLTLMGVSSGVYLGNEMVVKNVWEEIEKKILAAEKLAQEGKTAEWEEAAKEIDKLLLEVYS